MFPQFKYLPSLRFADEPDADAGTAGATDSSTETDEVAKTPEELAESIRKLEASLRAERDAHKATKASAKRVTELESQLEAAKTEKMTETEKAIADARKEAADEISSKYADRLVSERVRSLAAGRFAEPADVIMFLRSSDTDYEFGISEDLEIDEDAINAALEDVAKARPHWLKSTEQSTADASAAGIGGQSNKNTKRATSIEEAMMAKFNARSNKR